MDALVVDVWAVYRLKRSNLINAESRLAPPVAGLDEAGGGAEGRVPQTTNRAM